MSEMSVLLQNPSRHNSSTSNRRHDIAAELLQAAAQASNDQVSSAESDDEVGDASPDSEQKPDKRKKRSRACQACRNMKIRCNPVKGQEACLACSKVNRQCVMPGPARKRQKTVHKVAELEKKINALTQSLLAKTLSNPTPQPSPLVNNGSRSVQEQTKDSPEERSNFTLFPNPEVPVAVPQSKVATQNYVDVIDRGIVSVATANRLFDQFNTDMNPLCPLVAFPSGTTAENVRRSRPMLFLAILTSGSFNLIPEVYTDLTEELARQLADRIFYMFERSVDLVQAALIHTSWVGKHKNAKDVGFNQYIHGAIVMAHDLGLSKRLKTPLTRNPVEEAEIRRTWLACYWCGICVSTTLRHPPMIRSSPYVQECIAFFKDSPATLPTDHTMCAMAKIVMIMEDVTTVFHMDDPASAVSIEDASTQYSLKIFEKRLEDWRKDVREYLPPALLTIIHATASLYIHEIALHTDHNVDDFRPPSGRPGALDEEKALEDFITPSHLDAISKCVVAMKEAIDAFLKMFPSPEMKSLPCLMIVWTAYCIVAMIRLDGALRASNSKYAQIFLPDLKVDFYLNAIIECFSKKLGASLSYAPFSMFHQAFQKLRAWHQYRSAGVMPSEHTSVINTQSGMYQIASNLEKFTDSTDKGLNDSSAMVGTENGMMGPSPAVAQRVFRLKSGPRLDEQQSNTNAVSTANPQGFDTQGGSWITNSHVPIDASMFDDQDWNFTFEDWNNFEASMVQPAGGTWLGYLL